MHLYFGGIAIYFREPANKRMLQAFERWSGRFVLTFTGFSIGHWGIALIHQRKVRLLPSEEFRNSH